MVGMARIGSLVAVTIDCPEPAQLADFYRDALDWDLIYSDEHAAFLSDGGPLRISLQRVDRFVAPRWPAGEHPQQLHLDIAVVDVDKAERLAIELGARTAPSQPGGSLWRVMLDPVGHPFCLTTAY
jgi:hypothetical protein